MKRIIGLVAFLVLALQISAFAYQRVNGYTKSNGTYVNAYNRSDANSTTLDNYSHSGNVNPWTGKRGYNNN